MFINMSVAGQDYLVGTIAGTVAAFALVKLNQKYDWTTKIWKWMSTYQPRSCPPKLEVDVPECPACGCPKDDFQVTGLYNNATTYICGNPDCDRKFIKFKEE